MPNMKTLTLSAAFASDLYAVITTLTILKLSYLGSLLTTLGGD